MTLQETGSEREGVEGEDWRMRNKKDKKQNMGPGGFVQADGLCQASFLRSIESAAVIVHTLPSGGRGWWVSEFEASLVYRVSFRTGRAT